MCCHWSLTRLLLVIALITLLAIGVVHECAFRAEPISRHHYVLWKGHDGWSASALTLAVEAL